MKPVPPSPVAPVHAPVSEDRKPEADAGLGNASAQDAGAAPVREIGGRRDGTEPTRFGDWEKNGRCIDF